MDQTGKQLNCFLPVFSLSFYAAALSSCEHLYLSLPLLVLFKLEVIFTVRSGPRMTQNPRNFLYNNEELVDPYFHCMASGYPEPVYHWYKQDSVENILVEIDTNKVALILFHVCF